MENASSSDASFTSGADDASVKIHGRIARCLARLRNEQGWTLDELSQRTGISRATLSRLERCELSPTAAMLSNLCGQYGWTLSGMMTEVEDSTTSLIGAGEQAVWQDPETGYIRRMLSPPHPKLRGELVEVTLPAGSTVSYPDSYLPGLEHHLWMLEGAMSLELEETTFRLKKGDCIRYVLHGPSRFICGRRTARYVIAMVRP